MDSSHRCSLYQKFFTTNLWPLNYEGYPMPHRQVGVLELHYNGDSVEALQIAKRDIEEAIKSAKEHGW